MLSQLLLTLRWALRDRLFHAVLAVALVLLLLVPVFSSFSMRQVQELAITLSLSALSFILLVLALLLGASSVWRDVERRYTSAVLTLPASRAGYVLGKFGGIALFMAGCTLVLGCAAVVVIKFAAMTYPSDLPLRWTNVAVAVAATGCRYILLAAVALLFSAVSTSFFLPFFGTLAIHFSGGASQQVYEYVSGAYGTTLHPAVLAAIKGVYYLIPNLGAFNFQVEAIYSLPLAPSGLALTLLYFLVYTGILLATAVWLFSRRELP